MSSSWSAVDQHSSERAGPFRGSYRLDQRRGRLTFDEDGRDASCLCEPLRIGRTRIEEHATDPTLAQHSSGELDSALAVEVEVKDTRVENPS
jgi:hypothetical protein